MPPPVLFPDGKLNVKIATVIADTARGERTARYAFTTQYTGLQIPMHAKVLFRAEFPDYMTEIEMHCKVTEVEVIGMAEEMSLADHLRNYRDLIYGILQDRRSDNGEHWAIYNNKIAAGINELIENITP